MTARSALLFAAWLAAALPVAAREAPPPIGEPRDFRLPEKETLRLGNGLGITFIDYGSVPKVTVLAVVRTGSIDEGSDTWLSDVAAEMMKEGTATRTAPGIARLAADMGGSLGIAAGAEQLTVGISVLSEHAAEAAALVADVLRRPRLPESELPRVIANFERRLSVARNEPGAIAGEALARLVWGDHPFGRTLPASGQLAGYDIAAVRGFHSRKVGAARTHVYVAGRYDRRALEQALRAAFADWPPGPPPTEAPPTASRSLQLQLIDRPGAPQSSLRIALPVAGPGDEDYFPTTIMNTLLGGSFASRITTNIREDKGYTYSPFSSLSARRGATLWVMSADVTTEHTAAAMTEIHREIERLQREPPPAAELRAMQNYRAGLFVVGNSSPDGVLGQLAFMDLLGLPDEFLTRWVASVYAVTPSEVSEMARRWIVPGRMTVVIVGDLARIADEVRALPQLQGAASPDAGP